MIREWRQNFWLPRRRHDCICTKQQVFVVSRIWLQWILKECVRSVWVYDDWAAPGLFLKFYVKNVCFCSKIYFINFSCVYKKKWIKSYKKLSWERVNIRATSTLFSFFILWFFGKVKPIPWILQHLHQNSFGRILFGFVHVFPSL